MGSLVGQLCKRKGAKVVGIAGSPAKCTYLKRCNVHGPTDCCYLFTTLLHHFSHIQIYFLTMPILTGSICARLLHSTEDACDDCPSNVCRILLVFFYLTYNDILWQYYSHWTQWVGIRLRHQLQNTGCCQGTCCLCPWWHLRSTSFRNHTYTLTHTHLVHWLMLLWLLRAK